MTVQAHFPTATGCPDGFYEINVDDLKVLDPSIHRIDVRESHEFVGEMNILPGVEHVSIMTLPQMAPNWDPSAPLVIICRSGARSGRAALWLQEQGFTSVVSLRGGMLAVNGASC